MVLILLLYKGGWLKNIEGFRRCERGKCSTDGGQVRNMIFKNPNDNICRVMMAEKSKRQFKMHGGVLKRTTGCFATGVAVIRS